MLPVIAENHHLTAVLMDLIPLSVNFKQGNYVGNLKILKILLMVGAVDDHLMNIGYRIFVRDNPDIPTLHVTVSLPYPGYFRGSKAFISRTKYAYFFGSVLFLCLFDIIRPVNPCLGNNNPPLRLNIRYKLGHIIEYLIFGKQNLLFLLQSQMLHLLLHGYIY